MNESDISFLVCKTNDCRPSSHNKIPFHPALPQDEYQNTSPANLIWLIAQMQAGLLQVLQVEDVEALPWWCWIMIRLFIHERHLAAGIGGDAFALMFKAADKKVSAVMGCGRSPTKMTLDVMHLNYSCCLLQYYHGNRIDQQLPRGIGLYSHCAISCHAKAAENGDLLQLSTYCNSCAAAMEQRRFAKRICTVTDAAWWCDKVIHVLF